MDKNIAMDLIQNALTVRMQSELERGNGPEFTYSTDVNPTQRWT